MQVGQRGNSEGRARGNVERGTGKRSGSQVKLGIESKGMDGEDLGDFSCSEVVS